MRLKLLLFFLVGIVYSCRPIAHSDQKKSFSANRINVLQEYVSELKQSLLLPGISVVVLSNDSVYCYATGIANAQKDSLTIKLPFSAGSISEPMLATAIMKLVAAGTVNLDDPVVKYLPYFKMAGIVNHKVTIQHLLSHTSGVQKYTLMWDLPNNTPNALEITTRSIANQQPKFPVPGSRVSRTPYNYDILADLISKVTGHPFEEYLKMGVFKPLTMNSSSFYKPGISAMPFSVSNWLTYSTKQDSLYPYNRENGGSNGLHSSPLDIASWMFMLLNQGKTDQHTFIKKTFFNHFFSPQYHTSDQSAIGFGWDITRRDGEDTYTKNSKITNFSSQVTVIPTTKTGVAVFSNIGNVDTEKITRSIVLWLRGGRLPHLKTPVNIAMSRKFAESNNLDSALSTYKLLKQSQTNLYDLSEDALNNFGTGFLQHFRDKRKAIAVFKFCILQFPLSAKGYLNLAEAYAANRDFAAARAALEKSKTFQRSKDWGRSIDIERYIAELTADPDPG